MITRKKTDITNFLKDNCANYDRHYDICLRDDKPCDCLTENKRCGYFEKCVLGPADYPYRIPGYDYAKIFAQYADLTNAEKKKVIQRKCDCGEPLRHRQRFCDKCRKIRSREAGRERVRKHRFSNSLNVTL